MLLEITSGALNIAFAAANGGLPSKVTVKENDGRLTTIFNEDSWKLQLLLADGKVLSPVATAENLRCYEDQYCTHVDFVNVHFKDQDGKDYPDHYLVLRHEFYPDGTAFSNMYFFIRDVNTTAVTNFALTAKPDFSGFDSLRWSCRERPTVVDGTMITAQTERFILPGNARRFEQTLPLAGFNLSRKFAPSLYCEFFMEGQSSLSNNPRDTATTINWNGLSPELTWEFQKCAFPKPLVNQLRNQWGWNIRPAQGTRHLPPMRMYHYFDNYERYPSDETIAAVIAAGCDVFIMHENWRCDTQNDGVPFDYPAFIKLRDALHAAGIRLAVYIRGNEESVMMRQAEWFKHLLTYNFDGLYMDYGGPMNRATKATELYCGGRINFREHYRCMRTLREQIGPDGVFYSHTGPSFSAISIPFMTGYVSGEGERGLLIRGREEYEYYSMSAVGTGTLWSAAFPEYASKAIIPFIAATGQYPHSNLGEQFASSSLVHPRVPGINDKEFVPLWKLWSVLAKEKDLTVVNDINSTGIFARDAETGHCMYIAKSGNFALLTLGNFADESRSVDAKTDLAAAGFTRANCQYRLLQDGKVTVLDGMPATVTVEGHGVCGILITAPELTPEAMLTEFLRPQPELFPSGKAYLARVEEQRKLRFEPAAWQKTYMRLVMPDLTPTPYEDSMTVNLFDSYFELGSVAEDGTFTPICFVDKNGVNNEWHKELNLFCGDVTPTLCLNDLVKATGDCRLAVRSTYRGAPFYSFCYVDLAPDANFGAETRRLEFLNDIEPDRAFINFTVKL
ncbi:MAG: hypothetical protein IKD22_02770 [Lentisphaeria bacterium]|nr:hypothetical protein [Lentisphaeria bacterium]